VHGDGHRDHHDDHRGRDHQVDRVEVDGLHVDGHDGLVVVVGLDRLDELVHRGDVVERELTVDTLTDRFHAMGTTVEVTVVGGAPSLLTIARGRIRDLERRWSRFLPASEVSRLNAAPGVPLGVSPETVTLVSVARDAARMTDGRFDPLLLDAVEAIGYRDTFTALDRPVAGPAPIRRHAGAVAITIDADGRTVTLPAGARFDPGGIGKGLAADLVADELRAFGASGVCVNVGGDLRVTGAPPGTGDAWLVAVRDRPDDEPVAHVAVADGGVATTSRSRRRWTTADGIERHHVIDPATGRSARTPVTAATAIAADAWRAEVLSTVAFLDRVEGIAFAEHLGATAMVSTETGVVVGAHWSHYARELTAAA
jgi:thiamine biosynthesis lipoprotein